MKINDNSLLRGGGKDSSLTPFIGQWANIELMISLTIMGKASRKAVAMWHNFIPSVMALVEALVAPELDINVENNKWDL